MGHRRRGFAAGLAAARAWHRPHGALAAPRGAAILDVQIMQWLTNVRRPGGLGKDPVRAGRRAAALAAIDADWNPGVLGWTVDWQRHYAYLAQLLEDGARLTAVTAGVTRHGAGRRVVAGRTTVGLGPAERGAAGTARRAGREAGAGRTGPHGAREGQDGRQGPGVQKTSPPFTARR
ncbi:hypothetical protein [Streptomyces erythrochromogenes]|uniref:hypothetical protein n=1 Tax=Streptomyces erythrochromogenes TaxID=285574 RepID=UPI0037FF0C52